MVIDWSEVKPVMVKHLFALQIGWAKYIQIW